MAVTTLIIQDQHPFGKITNKLEFVVRAERLSVHELICQRIHQEVSLYNASLPEFFHGLIQPTEAERTLNGYRLPSRRKLNWEIQAQKALHAFETGELCLLVNGQHMRHLDQVVEINGSTRINLIKQGPLVGG